ncbi:hypothetical protein KSP39_PZI018073 [Platanthera zijinensis]|uniref:Synergin gamma C-terminal domain-containing protein n=1 Tax=Platanthera zijinensis TaxID=2320716 RepID=A0AAP0B3Y2_9ASPA
MIPSIAGGTNGTNGVEDDDDFGDFVFSTPSPSHAPSLRAAITAVDEDWGDFYASPLGSSGSQTHSSLPLSPPFDPFSGASLRHPSPPGSSQLSGKVWEKPKGAIPLSIFGEEDAEEPEPLERPGVFENGFASYSFSSHSSRDPTRKLNDLFESLYGEAGSGKEQEDDFDEGSWEFKDAFSAYTGPKLMDGEDDSLSGLKMAVSANENGGNQVDASRLENGWKGMEQFETNNQERIPGHTYHTHERLKDRSLGRNNSVTEKFHHELLPSFGNGNVSIGINGFKLEFPEYAIRNGSTEKIQADQVVLQPPAKREVKEVKNNLWDIDGLNISAYVNGKNNPYGSSEDHMERGTGIGKMDDSHIALTGIIHSLSENADRPNATFPSQSSINDVQEIDQHDKSSASVNGDIDIDQSDWEFQNAAETAEAGNVAFQDSRQNLSSELTSYTFVEFYHRLKEESLRLVVHHLIILQVPALPGATLEVKKINEEIQEAYGNMQETMASVDSGTGKKFAGHIDQLRNVIGTSDFKAVENEYGLSERLLAAENDLNAAVELFVHSSSVLHILRLASEEQQIFYIKAWSKLALACAQEVQLGAKILTESLDDNISKQLLSKGNKYFIALAEVFRVSKIMKATVRFYMPWLLSNLEDSSEILTWLEKGNQTWINSGLEETLKIISDDADLDERGLAKPLLESINLIDKVIPPTYLDPIFHHKHGVCKFYLLPLDKLPELKTVVWNGDCYITKLANFWANRISPDPPHLPPITPS